MEDTEIIHLYFSRSEEAITRTEEKYGSYCGRIAGNILRSPEDTQETLSDTWLAAWNAIPPQVPQSLAAFLGKITRRIAIKRLDARNAAKRGGGELPLTLDELSECIPSGLSPERELEAKELSAFLQDFVRKLPQKERRVFLLRYWYMEPLQSIAVRTGYSESKIKSMLFRTRKALKTELEKEGYTL